MSSFLKWTLIDRTLDINKMMDCSKKKLIGRYIGDLFGQADTMVQIMRGICSEIIRKFGP
jgi:hypothetical protein